MSLKFTKMISAVVLAASMLPALPAWAADALMLPQGTFEDYNVGDTIGQDETQQVGISVSGDPVTVVNDNGSKAIKIATAAKTDLNLYFTVEEGKKYFMSYDVRREVPDDYESTHDIVLTSVTAGWVGISSHSVENNADKQTVFSTAFTEKASGRGRIKMEINETAEGVVTYIDNIYIREYVVSDSDGLVANGDFEMFLEGQTPNNLTYKAKAASIVDDNGSKVFRFGDGTVYDAGEKRYDAVIQFENLPMTKDKEYFFSVDIRRDEAYKGSSKMIFSTYCTAYDQANYTVVDIPCSSDYKTFTKKFKANGTGPGRVKLTFIEMGVDDIYTYIDNIILEEVGDVPTVSEVTYNQIGTKDGYAVCPANAQITWEFDGALDADSLSADAILLNGKPVCEGDAVVTAVNSNTVKITLDNLKPSKIYNVAVAEGIWLDKYQRPVTVEAKSFRTVGRVTVGEKKLVIGDDEIFEIPQEGGQVSAILGQFTNEWSQTCSVTPILVLYKDGMMVSANAGETLSIPAAGTTENATASITVPDVSGEENYELVLYIWSDISNGLMMAESIHLAE